PTASLIAFGVPDVGCYGSCDSRGESGPVRPDVVYGALASARHGNAGGGKLAQVGSDAASRSTGQIVTVEAEPLFADRYQLEESRGGGSAEVHRGTDSRLGRTVVVKIAPAGSADFDRVRFENETLLLASLRHPGLVTLYDADTVGDRAYFVMQYVPGGSLAA